MTQIESAPTPESLSAPDAATGTDDPDALRRVVIGALLGFLAVFAVMAGMCWLVGIDVIPAVAVGVFVALFGGVGFGAMMGGSIKPNHRS
jgi:hypothetical protein